MDNLFAGQDISISEDFRERIEGVVQLRGGRSASAVHQPFHRNVDVWFFAIMLAVKKGLKPTMPTGKTYKAAEGVVLASDPWRSPALTLLAIAEKDDVAIIDSASEMMRIANAYAHAGFPALFSLLDSRGDDTALDYLCDEIEDLIG